MKAVHNLLTKLNLRYSDPSEETDYLHLKLPLVKEFVIYLFVAIGFQWIPLIIRYFEKHLVPQNYIAIALTILAVFIIIFRQKLGRLLEYITLIYLLIMICFSCVNTYLMIGVVGRPEAFYMGYASALLTRLLGYRIAKFHNMVFFHVVGIVLRFSFVPLSDPVLMIIIVSEEIFTLLLDYRSEVAERRFFDSLYKSKQQLLKFKHLLTENLPNQVAIFSKNFTEPLFTNKAFQKAFGCKSIHEIKKSFDDLIVEKESIEKNRLLLARLGFDDPKSVLNFATLLEHLSKNTKLFEKFDTITLQVKEKEDDQKEIGTPEEEKQRQLKDQGVNPKSNPFAQYSGLMKVQESAKPQKSSILKYHSAESVDTRLNVEEKDRLNSERGPLFHHSSSAEALKQKKRGDQPDKKKNESNDLEISAEEHKKRIFTIKVFLLQWDEDEAIALLLDNITHERTIMELKIADKNKDLVITMISHELRTPLNGILGLVDIAKKLLKDTEVLPYLNACKNSGILLLNFVNSILDLSQARNNKLKLVYSRVSIVELFNDIRPLFDYFCLVKKLYLKVEIAENVPGYIVTDKNRLTQILINLIGNAFKFTFNGGITVLVEMENEASGNMRFSVKDTGIGIKNQDQNKLFKLFGRLDQQNNRINTHGAGIGLTISNTLAVLLDSANSKGIHVESKFEQGSVFSFVVENRTPEVLYEKGSEDLSQDISYFENNNMALPKKVSNYVTTTKRSLFDCNADQSGKGEEFELFPDRKVSIAEQNPLCLIVDDTPLNLVVASHIMQEKGYQIKTCLNGKQAIEAMTEQNIQQEYFKLVLMDCQMPVMDGYEATRRLKEMMRNGDIRECPIVALTAHQEDKVHTTLCQEVGMDGTLAKPLQVARLLEILQKIQKGSPKERKHMSMDFKD